MAVPQYHEMFNPALQAVRELGGSCSISEMADRVSKILNLSEEDVNAIHKIAEDAFDLIHRKEDD